MNILLVYPEFPDTFWSFKHALKFVRRKASSPPLGLLTVASIIPEDWNKRLIDMNVCSLSQKDLEWADYVFLSAMIVQQKSAREVIARCNQSGVKIVAGGPLFTAEYEKFDGVDHFILNEAEITLKQFLNDLDRNETKHIYTTNEFPDIRSTPIPMWSLVDKGAYDSMSIQFSRGCPFSCDFCNITTLFGHTPRVKSAQQIIAELDGIYAVGWRRNVFFVDDNFIGNKKILKQEILPALIDWHKNRPEIHFITEASVNLSDDDELIQMMVAAGFNTIFVGIETPDENSLTECNKTQNKHRDLIDSVKHLQRAGLQVMGGFIVGFDNDTPSIFQRQIEFIQKSGIVTAMVGLLQAPIGTQLYDRLHKEGRLVDSISGDNTDGSTNIIPKMDIHVLTSGYKNILNQIYSSKNFYARVKTFLNEYKPESSRMSIQWQEVLALFRSIYHLGIRDVGRLDYWRLFLWSIIKQPKKFPLVIQFSIYKYHFSKVSEMAGI
jgi:radical SAM superfamily enzyme YgiQ (UPF0313 family)